MSAPQPLLGAGGVTSLSTGVLPSSATIAPAAAGNLYYSTQIGGSVLQKLLLSTTFMLTLFGFSMLYVGQPTMGEPVKEISSWSRASYTIYPVNHSMNMLSSLGW